MARRTKRRKIRRRLIFIALFGTIDDHRQAGVVFFQICPFCFWFTG